MHRLRLERAPPSPLGPRCAMAGCVRAPFPALAFCAALGRVLGLGPERWGVAGDSAGRGACGALGGEGGVGAAEGEGAARSGARAF